MIGNHKPSKWHRDPTVLISLRINMLFIYRNFRKLGVIYEREPIFRKWRWSTPTYNTKHRTFDEAVEYLLKMADTHADKDATVW